MMELAALRYTLCEDTTHIEECIIEELKAAPIAISNCPKCNDIYFGRV